MLPRDFFHTASPATVSSAVADKVGMVRACAATLLAALLVTGCRKGPDGPEVVANKFLRHVHRDNCAEAWNFFSGPSQAKIRAESAAAIKREPYYAEQFKP